MGYPNYPQSPQQPGYPQWQGPPPAQTTNGMAIASLICAFLFPLLGIIFGHVAHSQIKRTGESGSGLATAGLIIGYIFTVIPLLIFLGFLVFGALIINEEDHNTPSYPTVTETGAAPGYSYQLPEPILLRQ